MRIVGIRHDGGVQVASLSDDGTQVTVVAGLDEFWADAAGFLSREPAGDSLPAGEVEFVPPVLPGARVVCIGLNYLKHIAEGTFREAELPPYMLGEECARLLLRVLVGVPVFIEW